MAKLWNITDHRNSSNRYRARFSAIEDAIGADFAALGVEVAELFEIGFMFIAGSAVRRQTRDLFKGIASSGTPPEHIVLWSGATEEQYGS